MHINRTFSLELGVVDELNREVRPKLRSKFVNRAIKDRLHPQEINHEVLSDRRLMLILLSRDVSKFVKKTIALELGIDVEGYL